MMSADGTGEPQKTPGSGLCFSTQSGSTLNDSQPAGPAYRLGHMPGTQSAPIGTPPYD
jgi:hypothetical protein